MREGGEKRELRVRGWRTELVVTAKDDPDTPNMLTINIDQGRIPEAFRDLAVGTVFGMELSILDPPHVLTPEEMEVVFDGGHGEAPDRE